MSKIILTRGIPASGKSTWAKAWVQEDPERRVRVNRDDLRRMLFGATELKLAWPQEVQVSEAEKAIATTALAKGKDVVVDATNLRNKFVRPWFTLGYDVEFKDFEVDLATAIKNNKARGRTIPHAVIEKFYSTLTDNGKLRPAPENLAVIGKPYVRDESLLAAFIVDIDGTLAHIPEGGRSPYDYTRVHEDALDEMVSHLMHVLHREHYIIVMSGREDACRTETEAWLNANSILYDELHMRAAGDKRKDATVKLELFDQHVRDNYDVRGVFDDRNQVVNMWRGIGLKCYQVAEGAF